MHKLLISKLLTSYHLNLTFHQEMGKQSSSYVYMYTCENMLMPYKVVYLDTEIFSVIFNAKRRVPMQTYTNLEGTSVVTGDNDFFRFKSSVPMT